MPWVGLGMVLEGSMCPLGSVQPRNCKRGKEQVVPWAIECPLTQVRGVSLFLDKA